VCILVMQRLDVIVSKKVIKHPLSEKKLNIEATRRFPHALRHPNQHLHKMNRRWPPPLPSRDHRRLAASSPRV
jgi:hypothetical protein